MTASEHYGQVEDFVELIVDPEIFECFPGMRLAVVIAHDVTNTGNDALAAAWQRTWQEAGEVARQYGNAQSHPRVRPWRERLRALGLSPKEFPSSIEALLRRALKGGPAVAINPLVDFYNTVSLRHIVPAGGFDAAGLAGPIELRRTRQGDSFQALGTTERITVPAGEIAYATGDTILTRHFVWRQAQEGSLTESTRSLLLVSEILGEVEAGVAEAVLHDLRQGLVEHFDAANVQVAIVDAEHPTLAG